MWTNSIQEMIESKSGFDEDLLSFKPIPDSGAMKIQQIPIS